MDTEPKPVKSGQRVWTDAQREEQSRQLKSRQIWLKSTGPRSARGKSLSSRNSYKHGRYSFSRIVLGWYVRLAALRVKQAKIGWMRHEQNYRNELIARGHLYDKKKPRIMAFYPYFIVHPLDEYYKKAKSHPKPDTKPNKSMTARQAHAFFSGLSAD